MQCVRKESGFSSCHFQCTFVCIISRDAQKNILIILVSLLCEQRAEKRTETSYFYLSVACQDEFYHSIFAQLCHVSLVTGAFVIVATEMFKCQAQILRLKLHTKQKIVSSFFPPIFSVCDAVHNVYLNGLSNFHLIGFGSHSAAAR